MKKVLFTLLVTFILASNFLFSENIKIENVTVLPVNPYYAAPIDKNIGVSGEEILFICNNVYLFLEKYYDGLNKNDEDYYYVHGIKNIIKNESMYKLQLCGIQENGEKYIFCNFIFGPDVDSDWKQNYVRIDRGAGWYKYWQVYYNISSGQFERFQMNILLL